VADLRAVFDSGRTRPVSWRLAQLDALARMLVEHEAELLEAVADDLGRPAVEGWIGEISLVLGEIGLVSQQLAEWCVAGAGADAPVARTGTLRDPREPYGVVLVIGPWNYPQQLVLLPMLGALAAGNTVVVKPSELAPASSAALARLLPRYLDGVAVVEGGVEEARALLAEPFDYVFYTGGATVGRVVMEAAARHLTPVTLELGGKSPVIVAHDANLAVAAHRIAHAKFFNAGQTCVAPDYVLVERSVEMALIEQLELAITSFYGEHPERSPDYGRIVNDRHLGRLAGLLSSGEVVFGGVVDTSDRYVAPTILRHVGPDSPVMRDEIFGPILPMLAVDSVEEAIAFVNRRPKPLSLYVYSEDEHVCADVLQRTSSGGACVNGSLTQLLNPFLPFGGVGASGMGSYHGRATFETFSHHRSVMWRATYDDAPQQYPPYPPLEVLKQALAGA
jgi:aldehyde dehydrogenase (NAD+)